MMRAALLLLMLCCGALDAARAADAPTPSPVKASPLLGKRNSNQPINVASDKFIADANAKTGTWVGNAVVTQGDMRMRADSVRVDVIGNDNRPDKIVANGHVVVDSPVSGTVTGDAGIYNVAAHTVTMTGKVVLTNSKGATMRGTPLVVNLETGMATLGGRSSATLPGQPESQNNGRVQGVFTPTGGN
ncbi:MAG TPA: LptA/OstA family protein [Rhizomicrobium sp.]|nr:LptA/OstA family protein [Rhizomicrobium sp.]